MRNSNLKVYLDQNHDITDFFSVGVNELDPKTVKTLRPYKTRR